jgi:nicotinamidase-related amidase
MQTKYEEIIDISFIGKDENPIKFNEILVKASKENLKSAINDKEQNLLLVIDMQKDFMENGSLGVPNSFGDILRLTKWIYENIEKITRISVSIDTHSPMQIFHPAWWIDKNGNNPNPFTQITLKDLDDGIWKPIVNPIASREYLENLEKLSKKNLMIWTYHCLQGTFGCSLENQFANMLYFYSVARKSVPEKIIKGNDPITEMYGIFKAEYDSKNRINIDMLNNLSKYDKIIISGEAKSHCVLESIKQILDFYQNDLLTTQKIFILEDCMSSITGFEKSTENEFNNFKNKYKVNIVKSDNFKL